MFAIIETGGKQYQVETERYVDVELLDAKENETITFDKVVMIVDGEASKVGQPYVDGVTVTAKVLKHDKSKKVIVYKQRRKKGYRKKQGHRQNFTRILIEDITGSKPKAAKTEVQETAAEAPKPKKTATKKAATTEKAEKTATKKAAAPKAKAATTAKKTTKKTEA